MTVDTHMLERLANAVGLTEVESEESERDERVLQRVVQNDSTRGYDQKVKAQIC